MAGKGITGGRYRPAQARPTTLEELRQYVWQELQQIGGAIDGTGGDFTPATFEGAGTTGYVPDPLTEQSYFLRDDGTWATATGPAGPQGPAGPPGADGAAGVMPRPTVKYVGATAYTVIPADESALIIFTAPTPITVTLPPSSNGIPVGFICHLHQGAASQVTIVGDTGVTVTSARSLITRAQYSALSVFNIGTNQYTVVGDQE